MTYRILDLPGGQVLVDEDDLSLIRDLTVYVASNGYAYFSTWEDGRSVPRTLHGHLLGSSTPAPVDHINGNKLDNRRCNLRIVTPQVNQANRKRLNRNNTSGQRGVVQRGERWIAQITVNRKNLYLGIFDRIDDAVAARRAAEARHYGEVCPR